MMSPNLFESVGFTRFAGGILWLSGKTSKAKLLSWCEQIQVADREDLSTIKTKISSQHKNEDALNERGRCQVPQ